MLVAGTPHRCGYQRNKQSQKAMHSFYPNEYGLDD
jgi:hypothetical protein